MCIGGKGKGWGMRGLLRDLCFLVRMLVKGCAELVMIHVAAHLSYCSVCIFYLN